MGDLIATKHFKRTDADMTQGVIWKQLLQFAIPMSLGLLFQQFYNTFDAIVVGRYVGKAALAAVGSTGSIINMLVGMCAGLSVGASVVISQAYGAKDYRKLSDAVHTTVLVTFLLSIGATVVGILIVPPMLRLMKTPPDVFEQAEFYLKVYFSGMTGLLMYNMGSGILRAVGDSRKPLYFLIFSATLDIGMNFLFVLVFDMGIGGVAYSTVIAQFLSAGLVLFTLSRSDAPYALHWGDLRIKPDIMKKILAIGLPSSIQQMLTSFSNVFVQSYINGFGSDAMAGWSTHNKIDSYVLVPLQSISIASTTFVGQNYGAGKIERTRKGVRQALMMSIGITALLCALVVIFRYPLVSIFSSEPAVLDFGSRFIAIITPFYVLSCFNQIFAGALRGIGRAKTPTIIMLCSFVLFRQIYLYVSTKLGGGFLAVTLAYPLGWLLCSTLMTVVYRKSAIYTRKDPGPPAEPAPDAGFEQAMDFDGIAD